MTGAADPAEHRPTPDVIRSPEPVASTDLFDRPVELVVLDFDGVLTDNGVWVDQNGVELVRCDRSDSLGLAMLQEAGVPLLVLSTETNPAVSARCAKLRLPVEQGVADKGARLKVLLAERGIDLAHVVYVGNDVNDADCLRLVGAAVVVKDAHRDVLELADYVLTRPGGHGAVRELCDLLLAARTRRTAM
jgi:YrbI family 3-deoxy-D-manno-octulosonate 8-phosphate phosphatase